MTTSAAVKQLTQQLCALVFLPYDAFVSLDAIGRTLWRVLWSKQNLLEWKTYSEAHRSAHADLPGFLRAMWVGPRLLPWAFCS